MVILSFDRTASFIGVKMVQNGNWTFDGVSDEDVYILTTMQAVGANVKTSFGLTGVLTTGNTRGRVTITTAFVSSAGEEVKITNNADAAKVDYFNK